MARSAPTTRPIRGEETVGTTTFSRIPRHLTSRALAAARTAPIRPPISAWDELEGMPKYQVMRFQETAPISAASTTSWDTTPVSTMPLPSVAATSVEMSAPTTFATAAIPRATPGRRARVEMDVAMAFAESWNPLVKSKRRAVATTTAAAGKLELAARQGKSIPAGWALNEQAEATLDPRMAQKARRLLPLGGSREGGSHKGYGLAILVEILCGVLTGTMTALNADQDPRGHFFGAIRVDTFRPVAEFKRDMDRLIRELKSTPPIEGQERVYVAGEIEFETAEERAERGIPLLPSVLKGLREVSEHMGVPYDLE